MKRLMLFSMVILFTVGTANVFAAPTHVKVLSSDFYVRGDVSLDTSPYSIGSYEEAGFLPLSKEVSIGGWDGGSAKSSADFFCVEGGTSTGYAIANAYATAKWLFQPLSAMENLTIYHGMGTLRWSGLFGQGTGLYKWEDALG